MTGLTEVTLRKVYKELLENWDDLLPSNYSPVVPPEKAFPMASITSGRSSTSRVDPVEAPSSDKHTESKSTKPTDVLDTCHVPISKEETGNKDSIHRSHSLPMPRSHYFWKPQVPIGSAAASTTTDKFQSVTQDMDIDPRSHMRVERKIGSDEKAVAPNMRPVQFSTPTSIASSFSWPLHSSESAGFLPSGQFMHPRNMPSRSLDEKTPVQNKNEKVNEHVDT